VEGQCEIKGCDRPVKYKIFKTFSGGEKRWLNVCKECEQKIGQENLNHAGGYLTAKELDDLQAMRGAYPF